MNASTADDERLFCFAQERGGSGQLGAVGSRSTNLVDCFVEAAHRIVVSIGCDVLGQPDKGRSAIAGIKHCVQGVRQGLNDLGRMRDAIPETHYRSEAVVDRGGRITELLHLLKHGIGNTTLEGVAGQQKQRHSVGHGDCGGCHHVGCARAYRRSRNHDLTAFGGLGVSGGGQCHSLLVLSSPGGKVLFDLFKGGAQASDVAVPENGKHTWEYRFRLVVDDDLLRHQVFDDGLGGGESNCLHFRSNRISAPIAPCLRATSAVSRQALHFGPRAGIA